MRFTITFLILATSLPAISCPDLKGTFRKCHASTAEGPSIHEVTIEQKLVNRYFKYTFITKEPSSPDMRSETFHADGRAKITTETDQDTGISVRTSTTTRCDGETLSTRMIALMDSEEFANLTIQTQVSGTRLTQVYSGTSLGQPVSETIICE